MGWQHKSHSRTHTHTDTQSKLNSQKIRDPIGERDLNIDRIYVHCAHASQLAIYSRDVNKTYEGVCVCASVAPGREVDMYLWEVYAETASNDSIYLPSSHRTPGSA